MKHHLCPLELKLITMLFGLAIFLCGCSSGKPDAEYSYREMNEELKGQDVKIELKDGMDISAKDVKISKDAVSWVDPWTEKESKASIRDINKIVMKSHGTGALEGIGFGLFGGVGLVAIAEQIDGGNNQSSGIGNEDVGLILGGGIGIVVGSITGLIVGHSYNYEFLKIEQSDSLQNGK